MNHLKKFVAEKFPQLMQTPFGPRNVDDFWNNLSGKRILFHPSSGMDHSSVLYFNRHWLHMLEDDGPEVIIRTDGNEYDSIFSRRDIYDAERLVDAKEPQGRFQNRVLYIHQTTIMHRNLLVIELYGILNEDVLRCFLEDGTEVRYLYSYCDGIMSGMGGMNPEAIPTLYYTYFFGELRTKYQISEYLTPAMLSGQSHYSYECHATWMSHIHGFLSDIRRSGVGSRAILAPTDRWFPPEGAIYLQLNMDRRKEFSVRNRFDPIGMLINNASSEFNETLT